MKQLNFIQACPDDDYYIWQVHLWLESLREIGHSDKAISCVFTPDFREFNTKWKELEALYPESEFFFYKDTDKISKLLGMYIPLLRPYILMKYWKANPHMEERAIFYCDCDILFTDKFDLSPFINDEVCYLSDTHSYISATYFDSKVKDVKSELLEEYKKRDILQEVCEQVGITREIAEKNNDHSGGAQYLLKGITEEFWSKVITDCIRIRHYLQQINKTFFENENKGFQSWCADMWAVLWNLWLLNKEVKVVKELDFAWASDNISKLETKSILHNAGIVGLKQGNIPVFYKGTYHQGKSPFSDPYLEEIYNNESSKTLCSYYYTEKLIQLKNKFKLI